MASTVVSLNSEQTTLFQRIISSISLSTCEKLCLFVSGTAGTGKSHLIGAIIQQLEKQDYIVCAPTGVASKSIKGQTIHSVFRLDYLDRNQKEENLTCPSFPDLKLVIIDEISQCGAQLFDRFEKRLRQVTNVDKAFGNVHVVMFGDLLQIPPVRQMAIFESKNWHNVKFAELSINQRQLTDPGFAEMLSRWRLGHITGQDLEFLKSRILILPDSEKLCLQSNQDGHLTQIVEIFLQKMKPNSMILSPLNANVSRINAKAIALKFKGRVALTKEIYAKPIGGSEYIKTFEPDFDLALGAQVMITQNLNCGLVNGEMAIVSHIQTNEDNQIIWVDLNPEFDNKRKIRVTRVKKCLEPCGFADRFCLQIPIQPCYSATYHRAQGQTLGVVFLEILPKMDRGLFFVGASRVKQRDDLYLVSSKFETVEQFLHVLSTVIHADSRAIQEIARLSSM